MTLFLTTSLGYPTLAWSIVLGGLLLFWLVAAIGLLGLDALDIDLGNGEAGGMVSRLGLDGLPSLLVLSVLAFFAWAITYFVHLFLLGPLPDLLRYGLGTLVLLLSPVPAILLTAFVLRPLRRFVLRLRPPPQASLVGRVAVVRTPTVDGGQGMADLDDGGAGLILQVRHDGAAVIARGDRVVLLEHDAQSNTWRVLAERDHPTL
ncbi:MAG TPA: hypothetical protein PK743_06980 [Luteimonas sp.]|nr:hypothetical protein [Luteimonas sp.]HRO25948.1 hypothetical protein [Luteimonas sp.]HRP72360.1 hypothetical protein [Luteimonas sp.]